MNEPVGPEAGVHTRYWHALSDCRVQCDVCPRNCRMREGQRGLCFVRGVAAGAVRLFTYGRSSGFCIDPIEKKSLNHFLPGSSVLSFGTAGCNLACKFCQNWDMSKSREMHTLADRASPTDLAAAARLGCASIAYTYNDPTVFMEYAVDVAQAAGERGVRSVTVTAGYMCPEPRAEFFRHMDAANIDLKGFREGFYRKICGAELGAVLETLEYVHLETRVWLEVTTLLIPGLNDSDAELEALAVTKRTLPTSMPTRISISFSTCPCYGRTIAGFCTGAPTTSATAANLRVSRWRGSIGS